jgi:hypothetical protein
MDGAMDGAMDGPRPTGRELLAIPIDAPLPAE